MRSLKCGSCIAFPVEIRCELGRLEAGSCSGVAFGANCWELFSMWDSLGVEAAESVECDFLDGALPGVQMTQSRAR